jgi:hypothetical protein
MLNALAIPLLALAYVGATAALALLLRVQVYQVAFGIGPTLIRTRMRNVEVLFRLLPVAGAVRLESEPDDVVPDEGAYRRRPSFEPQGRPFSTLSRLEQGAFHAIGVVATALIAIALLGADPAWRSLANTWGQWFGGAVDPLGRGRDNVRALLSLLGEAPWAVCAGVLAAKMAALNALPMPPLSGFQFLHAALWRSQPHRALDWLVNLGVLAHFVMILSYGLAAVTLLW